MATAENGVVWFCCYGRALSWGVLTGRATELGSSDIGLRGWFGRGLSGWWELVYLLTRGTVELVFHGGDITLA